MTGTYFHFNAAGNAGEIGYIDNAELKSFSFTVNGSTKAVINPAENTSTNTFQLQSGGAYYKKYLKYKSKYLQIK
jgi:hypothetical protein